MGLPDSILGQFGETPRCHAQDGDRVCCALTPQLVIIIIINININVLNILYY